MVDFIHLDESRQHKVFIGGGKFGNIATRDEMASNKVNNTIKAVLWG